MAIRTVLVGFGYGGRVLHAPLIAATAGLDLVSIVSSRTEDIAAVWPAVTTFPDLNRALSSDIDLVVICTPNDTHAALAHTALDAGAHILIDKPFAVDLNEAQAIADHARRVGKVAMAFQNRRWDGHIITAKRLLAEGAFGTISDATLSYDRLRHVNLTRPGDQGKRGGGAWLNLGPHLADQAVHLFGPPRTVMADIFAQRPNAVTDDAFHVLLGYDGFRVTLRCCLTTPAPSPVIALHGTRGSFVKYGEDTQEAMLKTGETPRGDTWGADAVLGVFTPAQGETTGPEQAIACGPGNYPAFYQGVVACLRDGAPAPVSLSDTLTVQAILDAAFLSAREGRRIAL